MNASDNTAGALPSPTEIGAWWIGLGPAHWFVKDLSLDEAIRQRFGAAHAAAAEGRLAAWEETADGMLVLLLLLDQFPRNMFRGSPQAFATDPQALAIAERAIAKGFDRAFDNPVRRFFYLPHMHSEALADQERCVALCWAADDAEGVHHAEVHADIIRRFGRFPHRNPLLGRQTTADEQAFLDAGGFAG